MQKMQKRQKCENTKYKIQLNTDTDINTKCTDTDTDTEVDSLSGVQKIQTHTRTCRSMGAPVTFSVDCMKYCEPGKTSEFSRLQRCQWQTARPMNWIWARLVFLQVCRSV